MTSSPHLNNHLLASLPAAELEALLPHLKCVDLQQEKILYATGDTISRAYFLQTGVVSLVVDLAAGETIEIAMIGRDSVVGSDAALNGRLSLNRATVQVAGRASEIDVGCLRNLAGKSIFFREALVRHNHMVLVQAQQSAACNAVHTLEARLSRWLLRCRDLAGDDLALTQELLSRMLGVRRTSVTVVAHSLQTAGFIRYKRGHIHILDSEGLSDSACECYQTVKEQTETLRASPLN